MRRGRKIYKNNTQKKSSKVDIRWIYVKRLKIPAQSRVREKRASKEVVEKKEGTVKTEQFTYTFHCLETQGGEHRSEH